MNGSKRILCMLLALVLLAAIPGCQKTPEKTDEYALTGVIMPESTPDLGHSRVFYEIFVGSFSDSDGDGTGDLRGVINRMDYLNDGDPASGRSLGIGGIWLTPIFKSPSYHKYDVTDYYTIDPAFGTEQDLKDLISLCHERGVLLILDLPINHTGKFNKWYSDFVVAHRQGDTSSEWYDFYSWYDHASETAPAGRTFAQVSGTDHYYECNFDGDMPELNFDSEAVKRAVVDIAKHYLEMGVDGFRFDAAKYVFFGDNQKSVDFWVWYMDQLRSIKSDVFTIAEVWDGDGVTDVYYKAMNCFNFTVSQASGIISETAQKGDVNRYTAYLESYINKITSIRSGALITPFITNHDMDRAAGFLTVASGHMMMAANLYILGPGTPFIYYGEELGMRGSRGGANTDANRRLAMKWGDEDAVADPKGSTYPESNQIEAGASEQKLDPDSLYTYYKKVINARLANPEIALGEYKPLKLTGTNVGGFTSTYNGSSVTVIHNTTISSKTIDLSSVGITASELRAVLGLESASLEGNVLTIGAQTSVIIK